MERLLREERRSRRGSRPGSSKSKAPPHEAVVRHFEKRFKESSKRRPSGVLDGCHDCRYNVPGDIMLYRTQVYLRESQHLALKREASRRNQPMTEVLRDLIDQQLGAGPRTPRPNLQSITALGRGKSRDASARHDEIFGGRESRP